MPSFPGIFATVFGNSLENPSTPLSDFDQFESNGWGSVVPHRESASGVRVTRNSALTLPAFWRAIDFLSDIPAKLPCQIFKMVGRGKELDVEHNLYNTLLYQPNPETTAYAFFKTIEAHAATSGNGYAYIRRNGAGALMSMHHLDPENTWPIRVRGVLSYVTRIDNEFIGMAFSDVYHVAGLGFDGMVGYSIVQYATGSIGLGIATLEYAGRYFKNGAEPRVVIEVPGPMPKEAQTQFLEQWDRIHQGPTNQHKTAIVTNGGKVNSVSINARDSQLIEQRQMTIIDMSNITGIPPHLLGDGSRAAYNSLTEENRSVLDNKVGGRLRCHEQQMRLKLLTEKEKKTNSHVIRFDRTELTRATLTDQAAYYEKALAGAPWMTIDEVRVEEDMNPREGEVGDELIMPQGLRPDPAQTATDPNAPPSPDGQPLTQGDAGLQTNLTLNGAQVDAARQILLDLAAGLIAAEAAVELLVGVGIPRDRAQAMVNAQLKIQKTQADLAAEEAKKTAEAAPPPTSAPSNSAHRALLTRSCRKIAERVANHAKRVAKTPDKFLAWLDKIEADNRAEAVAELEPVLAACGIEPIADTIASGLVRTAFNELLNLSGEVSDKGLVGAVDEWSKRYAGETVGKLVDELFQGPGDAV